MNCFECREKLMEMARGGVDAPEANLHVVGCAECERAWLNQQSLSAGLRSIAANETAAPSAMLESRLLARFTPVPKRLFPAWTVPALACAAAVVAMVWIPMVWIPMVWIAAAPARHPSKVTPVVSPQPPAAAVTTATVSAAKPERRRQRKPARRRVEEPFVRIPYAAPLLPTERAEIVRVNLSARALESLGMPVVGADPDMRLNADLILGENGLARAVRIIQ